MTDPQNIPIATAMERLQELVDKMRALQELPKPPSVNATEWAVKNIQWEAQENAYIYAIHVVQGSQ